MNYRITFQNTTSLQVQISVSVNGAVNNFQIAARSSDDGTRASERDTVDFWWRDDGVRCHNCSSTSSPCARNSFVMPATDMTVDLTSSTWRKQTV